MNIEFFAAGTPKGQPRPRAFAFHGKARVYDCGSAEGWKSEVAIAARSHLPAIPMAGAIRVHLYFRFARPQHHFRKGKHADQRRNSAPRFFTARPDVDNLAKAVLDALTVLGFWHDDAQVESLYVVKNYADMNEVAGCAVKIEEVN